MAIDVESLSRDLSLAVKYASRAGLLTDKTLIDTIQAAENTKSTSNAPDVHSLTLAINGLAHAMSPITLADLCAGRDPFDRRNQIRAKVLRLLLTIFAMIVLFLIGYSMNALRVEQGAIQELSEIVVLHPELKLTALRMIAENDQPTSKKSALFDAYHQKMGELKELNGRMSVTYVRALEASTFPLFPFSDFFLMSPFGSKDSSAPLAVSDEKPAPRLVGAAMAGGIANDGTKLASHEPTPPSNTVMQDPPGGALCGQDADGDMKLPDEASQYPKWMRIVLSDTLSDFCFQLKVLSPDGQGTVLNQSMEEISFIPHIKDKVALRVTWFLPFLYGLLGSAVYMMRNVGDVRVPAIEWYTVVMRLSLGGVLGIVVGWFTSATSPSLQPTTTLSLPFALAFLTGYGIDAMFDLLDRLNRLISESPKST